MNYANVDPALRPIGNPSAPTPDPRMRNLPRLATGSSREGTPQSASYYNKPAPNAFYPMQHTPQMPVLSQTQQIQKLFELNPGLQQLQNIANKATEYNEDEEGEELDDEQLANSNAHSRENLLTLVNSMTPEQLERFNIFRRSGLNKTAIKKVAAHSDHQMSNGMAQLMSGVGKVFVGEMVAKARDVQLQWGDSGPLTPAHIREAYRLYKSETGSIGPAKPLRGKKLFRK